MLSEILTDHVLGLLAHTMGQLDQAVDQFEDALAFCGKAGYRPELAWTLCYYSDTLLARGLGGDRRKSLELLNQALKLSTQLGIKPLMDRVASRLVQPASRNARSPAGLRARELEILRQIAQGRSNREIADELVISLRTVATHVANILNKTDSSNRAEAASFATREGLA